MTGRVPGRLVAAFAAVAALAALILVPADGGVGAALPGGRAAAAAPAASRSGQAFGGVAAVGALFGESSGRLGTHFCTASVVHSAHKNLAVTAAHCVAGLAAGQIAFVPGYANGKTPYGVWQVARVVTDQAWRSSQDPDHDVAFLVLADADDGVPVEDVTGAEQLGTGWPGQGPPASTPVQVIGYPDGADQPVWCLNQAKSLTATQLEFDCDGYTNGTSGGPFLAGVSAVSGEGTVIGVIGGYQLGGDTPQVSYSAAFGTAVAALYQAAEAGG